MWSLLQTCDIVGSVLILLGLWNSTKDRRWWFVYCAGSGFFLYVVITKGLLGLTLMGIATTITGLKNAFKKSCQEKSSLSEEVPR